MEGTSPRRALPELLRRGTKNMRGADRLAAEANRRRRELLRRNNLDGTLQEIKKLLDEAVLAERKELARAPRRRRPVRARCRSSRCRRRRPRPCRSCPTTTGAAAEARQKYEQIKDLLGPEMLDQRFAGMKQALENATDEDRQRVNDMLDDLNDLLDKHARGEDTPEDFQDFMAQARRVLPGEPAGRRGAARLAGPAGRGRAAVPQQPDRRAARRAGCAWRSRHSARRELMNALNRLDGHLQAAAARGGLGRLRASSPATTRWAWARAPRRWPTSPNSSSSPSSCRRATPGARWTTSTSTRWPASSATRPPSTRARSPSWSARWSNQGFLDRGSDGQWRLSPKAMRQLGQTALRDVAQQLSGRHGERDTRRAGAAGELTGATRPWQFGDTEPWNVTRTLTNAVLRRAGDGGAEPVRCSIAVEDVEVSETETRTQAAVALLVDTSFSMVMENRWLPMKQTALALQPPGQHPVPRRTRCRSSRSAATRRTVTAAELTGLEGVYEQGTNLHHALALAGRHLRRHPNAQPVLLVVTDGEPTAHLEDFDDGLVGLLRLPAASADHRAHRARLRRGGQARRAGDHLPAGKRPGPGPIHRSGRSPGRRPGRRPGPRRTRRGCRRRLPAVASTPPLSRLGRFFSKSFSGSG